MITRNSMSVLILIILISMCWFEISYSQEDTADQILPDSVGLTVPDSIPSVPKSQVFYKPIPNGDFVYSENYFPYSLSHDIESERICYSIAKLTDLSSGFERISLGPYAQPEYLFHDGLPLEGFKIGDFKYNYQTFSLPLTGFVDSRRIPLTAASSLQCFRFNSALADNEAILYPAPIPDSGAITSAYMQRGDYGFTNTMVRFLSSAGTRARLGVTASFRKSDGYIESTKKELENFRFYNNYQLNNKYQFQQDIIFSTSRDDLKYLNDHYDYSGESKSGFLGFSLGLASAQNSALFKRAVFVYQRFNEEVRGSHDKFRQKHETLNLKLENQSTYSQWDNFLTIMPYIKNITFDPGYRHYAGINISDFSVYKITPELKINFSAETEINKYSQSALSVDVGLEYSNCPCLSLYGRIFRISEAPTDFELFAKSPIFEYLDPAGVSSGYAFYGFEDLDNIDKLGFNGGFRYEKHGIKTQMYLKYADLNNYYFWESRSIGTDTVYARPVSHDARQLAGGFDLETDLPLRLHTKLGYSYSRIEDSDDNSNLSLAPRHKALMNLYRSVAIPRLNLDVLLNVEGEYHSDIYSSPYNPVNLGDRLLMNFSVQFKIKTLTIYYNMDNVFDKTYRTIYDYPLGRGVWWGFLWNFYN